MMLVDITVYLQSDGVESSTLLTPQKWLKFLNQDFVPRDFRSIISLSLTGNLFGGNT